MFEPMKLADAAGYSEGFFRCRKKTNEGLRWIFINEKGETAIEPECDIAGNFYHGRAMIMDFADREKQTLKYGYIDKNGKVVIPKKYDDAIAFSEGKAYVMSPNKRGYIDTSGKFLFELPDNIVGYKFQNSKARISNDKFRVGYINENGKEIIEMQFEEAYDFSFGLAAANYKSRMGYIDTTGNFFLVAIWDQCREFKEGKAFAGAMNNQAKIFWAAIDTAGMKLTEYEYTNALEYSEDLAAVEKNGKWGFIDTRGFPVIDFKYDFAGNFKDGMALAGIRGEKKFGFIDTEGNFVITFPESTKEIIDFRFNSKSF